MMPANEIGVPSDETSLKLETPPSSSVADYFEIARAAFAQATRGKSIREFFLRIGECSILLRFADQSLVPVIMPAFGHLEAKFEAKPDLTICLGDLSVSDVALAFPGSESNRHEPEGAMWRHESPRFFVLSQNDVGALSLADKEIGQAFYWVRNAGRLPWYETGFPLRHLFSAFFQRRGRHLIHACRSNGVSWQG